MDQSKMPRAPRICAGVMRSDIEPPFIGGGVRSDLARGYIPDPQSRLLHFNLDNTENCARYVWLRWLGNAPVTWFFFGVYNGDGFYRDEFGDDFGSFEEARDRAQTNLSDIAREELAGADFYTVTCDVRNAEHRVV